MHLVLYALLAVREINDFSVDSHFSQRSSSSFITTSFRYRHYIPRFLVPRVDLVHMLLHSSFNKKEWNFGVPTFKSLQHPKVLNSPNTLSPEGIQPCLHALFALGICWSVCSQYTFLYVWDNIWGDRFHLMASLVNFIICFFCEIVHIL